MIENPLRIIRRFPRPVRLLLLGTLVNKLGTFVLPYLALVLLRDFHLREAEAARLILAMAVGLLFQSLLDPQGAHWENMTKQSMQLLMNGLAKEQL